MQFKDIIGQTVIANQLTEIIDSGRVSHAQLFLGPTSAGSLALAVAYSQYLNCSHRLHFDNHPDGLRADSCGQCPSCKKHQELQYTDMHLFFPTSSSPMVSKNPSASQYQGAFREFLQEHSQIGTLDDWYHHYGAENKQGQLRDEDANDMVRILNMKPYEDGYKVAILWMAEKMNITFANKILKELEEPQPRTLIILVAEDSSKMLSTIISRTQLVKIGHVAKSGEIRYGDVVVRKADRDNYTQQYVAWMRQLFKLNMLSLSTWVDEMAKLYRDQQKAFLLFAQEATRECFLLNNTGVPMTIDFGDAKFNNSFPAMITERNIEGLCSAFDKALFAIERNAHAKITLMELSFRISKCLKKR